MCVYGNIIKYTTYSITILPKYDIFLTNMKKNNYYGMNLP